MVKTETLDLKSYFLTITHVLPILTRMIHKSEAQNNKQLGKRTLTLQNISTYTKY